MSVQCLAGANLDMPASSSFCWHLLTKKQICWHLLTFADSCGHLLTVADKKDLFKYKIYVCAVICCHLLPFAAICCHLLTLADTCWHSLIFADVCWYLLIFADVLLNLAGSNDATIFLKGSFHTGRLLADAHFLWVSNLSPETCLGRTFLVINGIALTSLNDIYAEGKVSRYCVHPWPSTSSTRVREITPSEIFLGHPHLWRYFSVTLFRIAPLKAYFGYFRYDQVPSDPHRWSYFWDEKGRGPVVVLRFLERTSKYVAPSTMSMATI